MCGPDITLNGGVQTEWQVLKNSRLQSSKLYSRMKLTYTCCKHKTFGRLWNGK